MFYFGADLHAAHRIWIDRCAVTGDSGLAVGQLRDLAAGPDRPEAIVLGGDVTDAAETDGYVLDLLRGFMETCRTAGIPVYHITGNHDPAIDGRSIMEALGSQHIGGRTVAIGALRVHGLDYLAPDRIRQALADVPPCDYLVMHQSCKHLLGYGTGVLTDDDIPAHVGAVLVGHVHTQDSRGRIHSPGSMQPTSRDEGCKAHGILRIEGASVTPVRFRTRLIETLDATDPEKKMQAVVRLGRLQAQAAAEPLQPVAFVMYSKGDLPLDQAAYPSLLVLPLEAAPEAGPARADTAKGGGILSVLDAMEGTPEAKALVRSLLESADQRKTIHDWLNSK